MEMPDHCQRCYAPVDYTLGRCLVTFQCTSQWVIGKWWFSCRVPEQQELFQ